MRDAWWNRKSLVVLIHVGSNWGRIVKHFRNQESQFLVLLVLFVLIISVLVLFALPPIARDFFGTLHFPASQMATVG